MVSVAESMTRKTLFLFVAAKKNAICHKILCSILPSVSFPNIHKSMSSSITAFVLWIWKKKIINRRFWMFYRQKMDWNNLEIGLRCCFGRLNCIAESSANTWNNYDYGNVHLHLCLCNTIKLFSTNWGLIKENKRKLYLAICEGFLIVS